MRSYLFFSIILFGSLLKAQVYTVNSNDDVDDGVCDGIHCSFREAINASENDGVPSTIKFNIPGVGPFSIVPRGPFPTINHPDLTILGETQPGGAGSIVIDFNNRTFLGIPFWEVFGSRFYISGIDFVDYAYSASNDHLFQFGDLANNSVDSKIYNCAFVNDFTFTIGPTGELILVFKADNIKISNCIFGTDRSKSSIFNCGSHIKIDSIQKSANVTIDSNIFVNNKKMIVWAGGTLFVNKNIFGATDTFHNANLLYPENAIIGMTPGTNAFINSNFFFGFQKEAILSTEANNLTIVKNRFFNDVKDIQIKGVGNEVNIIADNIAREGRGFLYTERIGEIDMERNNISRYDTVFYNLNDSLNDKIRHIDNQMTCINKEVIVMDNTLFPSHAIPVIGVVNNNQITGTGNPNDSIVIYTNDRTSCPKAVCEAGVELGRTRADGLGNWILNASFPVRNSISAYQFDSDPSKRPTLYSEFSSCNYITSNNDVQVNGSELNLIRVSPNPASNKIKIDLNEIEPISILIYNSNGQKLSQQSFCSKSLELDLSNYNPGIYFLQFIGSHIRQISKIIKNNN